MVVCIAWVISSDKCASLGNTGTRSECVGIGVAIGFFILLLWLLGLGVLAVIQFVSGRR